MTFEEFEAKLTSATSREKAYNLAIGALKDRPRFDWTGIYSLEGEELVLKSFVGRPTEHTRIPVGKGICGTAVAEKTDQRVDDVSQVRNYLACSIDTKAELVVLIREGERIYGQIDIDSNTRAAFSEADHAEVKRVADSLAHFLGKHPRIPERAASAIPVEKEGPGKTFYLRCSVCKGEIAWGATWYKCTVSTCNRTRTSLQFCSTDCWDTHLPEARHRDPGFTEQKAPLQPTRR